MDLGGAAIMKRLYRKMWNEQSMRQTYFDSFLFMNRRATCWFLKFPNLVDIFLFPILHATSYDDS